MPIYLNDQLLFCTNTIFVDTLEMENELFDLCSFTQKPVSKATYVTRLEEILRSDVPATITLKDIEMAQKIQAAMQTQLENEDNEAAIQQDEKRQKTQEVFDKVAVVEETLEPAESETVDGGDTGTTALHQIVTSMSPTPTDEELTVALAMIDKLFEWGAGWMMLDDNDETAGCIALRRQLPRVVYDKFVAAGVRSEIFLRRVTEDSAYSEVDESDIPNLVEEDQQQLEEQEVNHIEPVDDPKKTDGVEADNDAACYQDVYLDTPLEYTEHALVTKELGDGVMMDWEDEIMKRSANLLVSSLDDATRGPIVLNIGFGMGIIDGYLQSKKPYKQYISEAHPDVLKKLRADGWYEKPNVIILEGRWQDTLPKLLSEGVYFDGIYYDTFSETYQDLVDFFDPVVGLLAPTGIFSFFNGLGADRQICYDVYTQVVEVDLNEYGLNVTYDIINVDDMVKTKPEGEGVWGGIKRSYWKVDEFRLPKCTFMA
ncbi:arginine N-methyltransferase 2 [Nadsonia fulvescens var. elongata DSM 6958]|uniref:Protein arginine N-methyltransferase 2 n=1 Tax=Nadsonia fulvescens var. elongata DSM 6958 TaxID=857566 RepID=A0A1E3PE14_9ASCO|nr:arginine N-methyltransferase 2 [Nadsonia fulvescens var. elongata DSM 6958]